MSHRVPLIVLAGSDQLPGRVPEGSTVHPLGGAKALDIELGGRPLIDHVLERLRNTDAFDPVFIAGPRSRFGDSRDGAEVIDTNASIGGNIRTAVETVEARFPGSTIGISTCDILPVPSELEVAIADWRASGERPFWFPSILAPDEVRLGASAWKPRYRVAPRPGEAPRAVLPGHLLFAKPSALRRPLLYTCFEVAYRGRNRSVAYRLTVMVGRVLAGLVTQDLQRLVRFEPPDVTITCLANGIQLGRRLAARTASVPEVETWLTRIFIRRAYRKAHPGVTGRVALIEGLSLAKDIDTREEAEELRKKVAALRG